MIKKKISGILIWLIIFILFTAMVESDPLRVRAEELMAAVTFDVLVDSDPVFGEAPKPLPARRDGQSVPEDSENPKDPQPAQPSQIRLTLGAYTNGYDNMMYVSLRDLAQLLNGTAAQFDFRMDFDLDSYEITKGVPYSFQEPVMVQADPPVLDGDYYDRDGNLRNRNDVIAYEADDLTVPAQRPDYEYLDLYMNPINLDGTEIRYYTSQLSIKRDIYMNIIDAQLVLGITIKEEADGTLNIFTDQGYSIDIREFEEDGYFDLYNGVILGDASTGEILYGVKENNPDAVASTSKLMTYMVAARYIELGRIGMDDLVTLSQNVENLSYSGYGTLTMNAGWQISVRDLIGAMLITSSNEAALALAEYIAGSEEEFVKLMNEMASVLELDSARFYNSNGLPVYSDSLIASKRQNMMNVKDLFRLSCAVLKKYPEVLEYTSCRTMYLPTLELTVWNTSYLLYNMQNAVGLKTGTTDEAGCCLVGAVSAPSQGSEHILVAIVIVAESNIDRYQIPQVLLTWGMEQIRPAVQTTEEETEPPH